MFFVGIVVAMLGADAWWWRGADRRLRRLRRPRLWRVGLSVFMGLMIAQVVWVGLRGRVLRQTPPAAMTVPLVVVYVWHLLVLPVTLIGVGVAAAVRGGMTLAKRARVADPVGGGGDDDPPPKADDPPGAEVSRRQFLGTMAVTVPPLLAVAGAGRGLWQIGEFRIRPLHVRVPGLPLGLEGMTIAHVSDVHVGRWTRGGMLKRIAEATNGLRADLVVLTGDLIDMSMGDLPAALDMVRRLDPRHGLVMVEGNHDLIDSRLGFERTVKNSGIPLLLNEEQVFQVRGEAVQLIGLRWAGADARLAEMVAEARVLRRSEAFPILLAHHPHAFDPAAEAGFPLTLSGHTHGGQLMLARDVGVGSIRFRYCSGLYRRRGNSLVVSNGVGELVPITDQCAGRDCASDAAPGATRPIYRTMNLLDGRSRCVSRRTSRRGSRR